MPSKDDEKGPMVSPRWPRGRFFPSSGDGIEVVWQRGAHVMAIRRCGQSVVSVGVQGCLELRRQLMPSRFPPGGVSWPL